MSAIWAFYHIKNKHNLYREEGCMKRFCEFLREHTKNIIDFEKKKMLPLTKNKLKPHRDAKVCQKIHKKVCKR